MHSNSNRPDDGTRPAHLAGAGLRLNALLAGTSVLTLDGALPVEFLAPGDRIVTRDRGAMRLAALRHHRARLRMVSVAAGGLGRRRPEARVVLPPTQQVLLRDGRARALFGTAPALVRAGHLAAGDGLHLTEPREADLVELVFDRPHILYAEGLELASSAMATQA
ncbi:Hint domain-containing protein [Salipiger mucosus]|uniref:Hedgehog/Intein (Hint) domain-containing protein n=1 Tax=Salipiger mucosus DSM 16094 TaxID=1123237 RepID=S9RQL1_9RHOB|nr:Hint domain-containing protein [Salipiger mucosus]EPX80350.1 hypothetical protein Salmuc_03665 [Salipiger mucosus DSM 16094]